MRKIRRLYVIVAVVAVAAVAVGLVANYELTSTSLAQVTVTGGTVHIEEGTTPSGAGWIGPTPQNYSGEENGYPKSFAAGSTFTVSVRLLNVDDHDHSLDLVSVRAPFVLVSTDPSVPTSLPAGYDASLLLTLRAPSSEGSYSFDVTLASLS
jgi:hypothetical protein